MSNTTTTTVTVTMTPEDLSLICEAIICGFGARRGDKNIAVDTEVAEQMRDIYYNRMKVTY